MVSTIFEQMRSAIVLMLEGVDVVANELDRIRAVKEELSRPGNFDRAHWERLNKDEMFLIQLLVEIRKGLAEILRRIDVILSHYR